MTAAGLDGPGTMLEVPCSTFKTAPSGARLERCMAAEATLADVGGVPYVGWGETDGSHGQLYVKRFDGSAWQQVGTGSMNVDTGHSVSAPSLAGVGGTQERRTLHES